MGRRKLRSKNGSKDDFESIKVLLLIIVIIIFAWVVTGLTYLFELINQNKLLLGAVSIFIIIGAVVLYRKKSPITSNNRNEDIINVTPITVNYDEPSHDNLITQNQEVKMLSPITLGNHNMEQTLESKTKSKIESDFRILSDYLESPKVSFIKRNNKKEKDYQDELWGQLRHEFIPGYLLEYEAQMGRHRLDILFNNLIGIELKVHFGNKNTRRELYNQLSEYSEVYQKMVGLVVNMTNENNDLIRQDIEKQMSKARIERENYRIIIK